MSNIEGRISKIVKNNLGLQEDPRAEASLEDLGADSLDELEIVMAVEEEFEIEIPDEKMNGMSIMTLAALVEGRI